MDIKDIKDLILTMDKTSIQKVDIEQGDIKISLSKSLGDNDNRDRSCSTEIFLEPKKENSVPKDEKIEENTDNIYIVKSPIIGTFYRSSSPDSEPFVKIGSKVEKGQTLCIIEAMKIMNEIEGEISGEVVEILVDNEEIVEYGQPLIKIRR